MSYSDTTRRAFRQLLTFGKKKGRTGPKKPPTARDKEEEKMRGRPGGSK